MKKVRSYTTVLLWGKYAYKRLSMGIACTPNIFQSIMMELLQDLEHVIVYIDVTLIVQKIGESVANHMKKIKQVLEWLDAKWVCANLRNSFFMQKEVERLGYLLTTTGLKPRPTKIEAIHRIMKPKNAKSWRCFLVSLNNRAFRYLKNKYANAYLRRYKRLLNRQKTTENQKCLRLSLIQG